MKRYRQVAAFILAGGASSRMGQDKGLLDFGGVPLVVRTARLIEPLVSSVTVVGSLGRYGALGLRELADRDAGDRGSEGSRHGPLAGVVTALADSCTPWNLILACDLPNLSEAWLGWLLSRAIRSRAQAVIPRTERGLEPLAAVYRRECGVPLAAELARGVRKVTDAVGGLHLEILHQSEWRDVEPRTIFLMNMNTPQDYNEALKARAQSSRESIQIKKVRPARQRTP